MQTATLQFQITDSICLLCFTNLFDCFSLLKKLLKICQFMLQNLFIVEFDTFFSISFLSNLSNLIHYFCLKETIFYCFFISNSSYKLLLIIFLEETHFSLENKMNFISSFLFLKINWCIFIIFLQNAALYNVHLNSFIHENAGQDSKQILIALNCFKTF